MKILITGGCGFIGSNFIHHLFKKDNIEVINVDKLTYASNLENLKQFQKFKNYHFIESDICDTNKMLNTLREHNPDVIVNFAAETHVDRSIDSPKEFINSNIIGTFNLLSCTTTYLKETRNDNFKFIQISTDEVFGSLGTSGYFTEESSYLPTSPYSASKASSDHLARSWFHTYGFPVIISNCSNNFGPYQFPEKLIPLMIANSIDERPLPIYGNGQNIRDWLYVEDHCDAIFKLISHSNPGKTYNIGGNNEKSNLDIVMTICEILNEKIPRKNGETYEDLVSFVEDRPGHDFRYAIDSSKIQNELSWTPKFSFRSALETTINWYLNNEKWWRDIQKNRYSQERLGRL
tara:strand:- start:2833 stop:3876 length:1044 start_codon:yes stop_codon:yes gene_type:complete